MFYVYSLAQSWEFESNWCFLNHESYKSLINIVIVPLHVLLSDWNLVTSKVILLNLIPNRHLNQTLRCFEKTMSFLLVLVLVLDLAFKIMTSLLYIRELSCFGRVPRKRVRLPLLFVSPWTFLETLSSHKWAKATKTARCAILDHLFLSCSSWRLMRLSALNSSQWMDSRQWTYHLCKSFF